jgi:gamma-D-glutamyl-L-lysine dipeptidyl-peptidase
MNRIICLLPIVPIRSEPSHRSEMISQLLFGEKGKILQETDEWIEITTEFDHYTGWLEKKSIEPFDAKFSENTWQINTEPLLKFETKNSSMIIPAGAEFPTPDEGGKFFINDTEFKLDLTKIKKSESLVKTALLFENAPYLWGGKSIMGMDCSGFVQIIYKILGIQLPRDAKDQAEMGSLIANIEESKTGDLCFFSNDADKIIHVGIVIEPFKIIHSSGKVRIDNIDNKGIKSTSTAKYTHCLKYIKRIK